MAFIQNSKFREISEAARNGNEKALMIIQALRKKSPQADLDALVNDYYAIPTISQEETENANLDLKTASNEEINDVLQNDSETVEGTVDSTDVVEYNINEILDKETDGLFDENEIDDLAFGDFLKKKTKDALRSKKGSEYFKAYNSDDRNNYFKNKVDSYKNKFDGKLKNIERRYNDINNSMEIYSKGVKNELDDNVELDLSNVSKAYDDLISDEKVMSSFGRYWDENDNNVVLAKLKELISQYGKQNVVSVLNTLVSDNNNHRDFLNNQIDAEISRYSKSIENILR